MTTVSLPTDKAPAAKATPVYVTGNLDAGSISTFRKALKTSTLKRFLVAIFRILVPRRLSIEEKAELAARKRLKLALEAKYRQLDNEARHYADTISRTLANQGVAAIEIGRAHV